MDALTAYGAIAVSAMLFFYALESRAAIFVLAFAVMLAAGMDGIERELPLAAPVEENLFAFNPARRHEFNVGTLPANLREAIDELEKDDLVCDTLGSHLLESFIEAKRMEWEEYRVQVTKWEIERYLAVY